MFIRGCIIIAFLVLCMPLHTSADFQAWMEKTYLQHQSKSLLKAQIKASDDKADLHLSSVKLTRQYTLVSLHESIRQIIDQFRQGKSNCALSYNDVAVLLSQHKGFQRYLSWIEDFNDDASYRIDTNGFTSACMRYLSCKTGSSKKNTSLSVDEIKQCQGDVADHFTRSMSMMIENSKQQNLGFGDEIFDNGTLEDSSFDLGYDISQINTILYANAKRIPTYYLRGPPNYLSQNTLPGDAIQDNQKYHHYTTLIPSRLYASNGLLPSVEDAINQIQSAGQADTSTITSNLQCFDPKPIVKSDPGKVFKSEIKRLNGEVLTLDEEKIVEEMIGVISQPYTDTQESPPTRFPTLGGETVIALLEPLEGENRNKLADKDQCPVNETNINEKSDISKAKPSVISCLKSCSSCKEGFFKKACYQGCLCNRYVEEKDFLKGIGGTSIGLKLCLVPSTTPDSITPGGQIVSIQEIVNQLSAILGKLKESGQTIPSNKPSEFFAPTTKIGKLANLINVRLNVTMNDKYQRSSSDNNKERAENYTTKQTPYISQVQIESMINAHAHHNDFIHTHTLFWEQMKIIFDDRASSMEQFADTQKH